MARTHRSPMKFALAATGWILLAGFALAFFWPFVWMGLSAMKSTEKIFTEPWALPDSIDFSVFHDAFVEADMKTYFWNSLVVTTTAVVGNVLLSALAGYAFARWRFRGQTLLLAVFLVGLILPLQAYLIPLRIVVEKLGLFDTRLALVLPYIAMELPFGIYVLRAFFLSLPRALGESAMLEGASEIRIFWSIYMPLAMPATASVAVITALSCWNEFLLAFLFVQDDAVRTISVGLLHFQGLHSTEYQLLFAGLTLVSVPLIVVYIVAQRYMIEGLTAGALKD